MGQVTYCLRSNVRHKIDCANIFSTQETPFSAEYLSTEGQHWAKKHENQIGQIFSFKDCLKPCLQMDGQRDGWMDGQMDWQMNWHQGEFLIPPFHLWWSRGITEYTLCTSFLPGTYNKKFIISFNHTCPWASQWFWGCTWNAWKWICYRSMYKCTTSFIYPNVWHQNCATIAMTS